MKERPILFSAPMVRAILENRKSQTRRIGKFQNTNWTELGVEYDAHATKGMEAVATYRAYPDGGTARHAICACPYGIPDNRLWVKETWLTAGSKKNGRIEDIQYRADEDDSACTWIPSIFMPRWASRITLGITAIRVERLQSISLEDCRREGIGPLEIVVPIGCKPARSAVELAYRRAYRLLWNSLNLKPKARYGREGLARSRGIVAYQSFPWSVEDFDAKYPGVRMAGSYRGKPITITPNPWVWVIEFKRVESEEAQ